MDLGFGGQVKILINDKEYCEGSNRLSLATKRLLLSKIPSIVINAFQNNTTGRIFSQYGFGTTTYLTQNFTVTDEPIIALLNLESLTITDDQGYLPIYNSTGSIKSEYLVGYAKTSVNTDSANELEGFYSEEDTNTAKFKENNVVTIAYKFLNNKAIGKITHIGILVNNKKDFGIISVRAFNNINTLPEDITLFYPPNITGLTTKDEIIVCIDSTVPLYNKINFITGQTTTLSGKFNWSDLVNNYNTQCNKVYNMKTIALVKDRDAVGKMEYDKDTNTIKILSKTPTIGTMWGLFEYNNFVYGMHPNLNGNVFKIDTSTMTFSSISSVGILDQTMASNIKNVINVGENYLVYTKDGYCYICSDLNNILNTLKATFFFGTIDSTDSFNSFSINGKDYLVFNKIPGNIKSYRDFEKYISSNNPNERIYDPENCNVYIADVESICNFYSLYKLPTPLNKTNTKELIVQYSFTQK